MANRLQIRRGSSIPTTSNLLSYELGWDTTNKILYINSDSAIEPISDRALLSMGTLLASGDNIDTIGYGLYCSLNSTVSTGLNGTPPTTDSGFKLFSYKNYSTDSDFQIAITTSSIKFRQENNNTWGNWYDVVTSKGGTTFFDSLYIKNPSADITASSLSSDTDKGLYFSDVNGSYVGYISAHQLASGGITQIELLSRHRNTGNTGNVDNSLIMTSAADGTTTVVMSNPAAWRAGMGAVNIAGDTVTGRLVCAYAASSGDGAIAISHGTSSKEAFFAATRTDRNNLSVYFGIGSAGIDHGIYSNGYYGSNTFTSDAKWLVYRDSSGAIILNGGAQQIITKGAAGARNVYVTTTNAVPSGAVTGDIVLVKV